MYKNNNHRRCSNVYIPQASKKERISTTIPKELADKARKADIHFSYALAVGLRRIMGDETAYDKSYSELKGKVKILGDKLSSTSHRLWKLQQEFEKNIVKDMSK